MKSITAVASVAALFAQTALAQLDPIVVKGSKFFYGGNGTQFFIKGVAYQQEYSTNGSASTTSKYKDPLADAERCRQDIPLMAAANTNTIRVYAVDPTLDHQICMDLLQEHGIYVVADLSEPGLSINRDSPTWNDALFERYASVVDFFAPYSNTIGFFAGNEVTNNATNTNASAFVKAAVRDTKAYIKSKNYRQMYVGYATNDDAEIREDMSAYFNCGDPEEAIDFWGYNIYSWCGDSSFKESGFDKHVKDYAGYSVPTFFAEYGCNVVQPRVFTEVGAIFGDEMTPVFSGGILYMWFQEANNYGLAEVQAGSAEPSLLPDYTAYSSQMAQINPTGVNMADYSPTNTALACPTVVEGQWEAASSPLPPPVNVQLCKCMVDSLSCIVGANVDEEDYGELFGSVCGLGDSCDGIAADAANGTYGAYSVCNPQEQLSFAFNRYYLSQNRASDACNFGGAATTKTATSATGGCGDLLSAAGADGSGNVGGSSGTSGGSSTSSAAAGQLTIPKMSTAYLGFAAYTVVAGFFGAGMILL
jgi:hypothetical protein